MKNFKKLPNFQVLRVASSYKGIMVMMQPIRGDLLKDCKEVPLGLYVIGAGGLYLPKKRRGERFLVQFTELREAEL